ncbi:hypothetical protein ABWH91_03890 [Phycisphaerales bacterium ac7]
MAEFVRELDENEGADEPAEVGRREHLRGRFDELAGSASDGEQRGDEQDEPGHRAPAREQRRREPGPAIEKTVGVDERELHEQEAAQASLDLAHAAAPAASEQCLGVGGRIGAEQVVGVELAEDLHRLAARRGAVTDGALALGEGVLDGARAVEQADEPVRALGDAEVLAGRGVLDDEPQPAPEALAGDINADPKARFERGESVP